MASYGKYIMMGVSTLLIPLATKAVQKLLSATTSDSADESGVSKKKDWEPLAEMASVAVNALSKGSRLSGRR